MSRSGDTKLKFILVREWPELRRSTGRQAGQQGPVVRGLFRLEAELGDGGGGGGVGRGGAMDKTGAPLFRLSAAAE